MADQAAADQGAAGAPEQGEQQQQEGGDRLYDAFTAFQQDMTGRFEALEQRIPEPQQPEPEPEPDAFDASMFQPQDYGDDGQLSAEAQSRALQELVDRRVQAAVSPVLEQREDDRRAAEADALEEKYPELADEKVYQPVIQQALDFAGRLGNVELAREPALIEMLYLAGRAQASSAQEVPAGSQPGVPLERGGSAGPVDSSERDDAADRIVALAGKHRLGGRLGGQ
jgi:hypothetical protein